MNDSESSARKVFCKDCRWVKPVSRFNILGWGEDRWQFAVCLSPRSQRRCDKITGAPNYCSIERGPYSHSCGPEGDNFEPRQGTTEAREIQDLERLAKR